MTPGGRPTLAPRARLRFDRVGNGYVLLAPERGFRLNDSAAAVLRLCDGQHSLLQIAQRLAPLAQQAQVLADVLALAKDLQRRGLLIVTGS